MDPWIIVFLTAASGITACLSVLAAFGGGMLLVAVMASVMDYAILIPVYGAVILVTAGWRVWLFRRDLDFRLLTPYLAAMLPASAVSAWVYVSLVAIEAAQPWVKVGIGAYLMLYLALPKVRVRVAERRRAMAMGGALCGLATMIVGAVGPIGAPFFGAVSLPKMTFIATAAASATTANLLKAPTLFVIWDDLGPEHAVLVGAMAVAGFVGVAVGRRLVHRVDDRLFTRLVRGMIAVAAAKLMLWDGIGRVAGWTG